MRALPPLCAALAALAPFVGIAGAQCEADKILASDGVPSAQYGLLIDAKDDRMIVGAPFDNQMGSQAGAAYLYDRIGGSWVEVAKIFSSDIEINDRFGFAVAIDGDVAVVGVRYEEQAGYGTGAAYVFERVAGVWQETQKLLASDFTNGTLYGQSVAVDGNRILVGAHAEQSFGPFTGAVYVYRKEGSVWNETQKLQASDPFDDEDFGHSVSLSGPFALIGAHGSDEGGVQSGAAYVFVDTRGNFSEMKKLVPSDSAADQRFGFHVRIDGDTAVVGAPTDDTGGTDSGSVYVFERTGADWPETQKLVTSDGANFDLFGDAVDVEGGTIVAGSWSHDGSGVDEGAVYVFQDLAGTWTETALLETSDRSSNDNFGKMVALAGDDLIACSRFDDDWGSKSGSVYQFSLSGTGCPPLHGAPEQIITVLGGTQTLTLDAGPAFAGDLYLVLGTLSGPSPGFAYQGFPIPLNIDDYFTLTLTTAFPTPLSNGFAPLDGQGRGTSTFTMPFSGAGALAGLTAHHAFGVLDPSSLLLQFTSNAEPLAFF